MARRKKGRAISGIVLVDKSQGSSSNHILQRVRAIYGAEKAGHTGALDPLATGMLPVCLGEATKFSQYLLNSDKTYVVTAKFGQRTDTSDADGEVVETHDVNITEQQILEFKKTLTGPIKQIPTMFSALKHNGQPLYKLARQGITVEREARPITVYSFELLRFEGDEADFEIHCSKGTYIRTLVDDLGQMLGCGAHVKALRRTKVADYPIEKMLTVDQIQQLKDDNFIDGDESNGVDCTALDSHLLPMDTALEGLTRIEVTADEVKTLRHGQFPARQMPDEEDLKAYQIETGEFIGVVSIRGGEIRTKRLVVTENFI